MAVKAHSYSALLIVRNVCMYMFLPDVVIPESPEAFVKLTEQTLRSLDGRQDAVVWKNNTNSLLTAC